MANFTVTTASDVVANDGLTSLREALAIVTGQDDIILFEAGLKGATITLVNGPLEIVDAADLWRLGRWVAASSASAASRRFAAKLRARRRQGFAIAYRCEFDAAGHPVAPRTHGGWAARWPTMVPR